METGTAPELFWRATDLPKVGTVLLISKYMYLLVSIFRDRARVANLHLHCRGHVPSIPSMDCTRL